MVRIRSTHRFAGGFAPVKLHKKKEISMDMTRIKKVKREVMGIFAR